MPLRGASLSCLVLTSLLSLTGCLVLDRTGPTSPVVIDKLTIKVRSGQHPVRGASLQLYEADLTSYTGTSSARLPYAVLTGADGNYTASTVLVCNPRSLFYLVATGGDAGGGNDPSIALMTAVGSCDDLAVSSIVLNEATTVASAYALAGFMSSLTSVSANATPGTNNGTQGALTGITNAFATVNNLVDIHSGSVLTATPAGNGTVPSAKIDSLANLLAGCIESKGFTSNACTGLTANARSLSGIAPADTVQAVLNIAHHPAGNVASLYALSTTNAAYAPALTAAPNDWTVALSYTASAPANSIALAIDDVGNVWIANNGYSINSASVVELSNTGAVLSGANGYTGGGMSFSQEIAIDLAGNAWVTGYGNNNVIKLSSSGAVLSGPAGYIGSGLSVPRDIAIDGQGNAWVTNYGGVAPSVVKLAPDGTPLSGSAGFKPAGSTSPFGIAIDGAENAWVANLIDHTVTKLDPNGNSFSGTTGFSGGGLSGDPAAAAIDAGGNAWFYNLFTGTLTKLKSDGSVLSGSNGFPTCVPLSSQQGSFCPQLNNPTLALDGSGNVWVPLSLVPSIPNGVPQYVFGLAELNNSGVVVSGPTGYNTGPSVALQSLRIDSSGNVWGVSSISIVTELVGAATPVVTPLAVGVRDNRVGQRP